MIESLKIQKICYVKATYNELELDEKWLERNSFNNVSTKHENSSSSPIKEIIVTTNDGSEISLKSENECEIFFDKYK